MSEFSTSILLFSFNRALQLDAVLRSLLLHCADFSNTDMTVLFKAAGEPHVRQYGELAAAYGAHENISFIAEQNFRRDVLDIVGWHNAGRQPGRAFRAAVTLGPYAGQLAAGLMPSLANRLLLFLVDDNIFVRDFTLDLVARKLAAYPRALGFSLRLGSNTTDCYWRNTAQSVPPMADAGDGVCLFTWAGSDGDFNYPLEVSSSVYRASEIVPLLHRLAFRNPNLLETGMARQASRFAAHKPELLSFCQSVTFCNPINIVQSTFANRAGSEAGYTSAALARLFDEGKRIDVAAYDGFVPTSCHQEVQLHLVEAGG